MANALIDALTSNDAKAAYTLLQQLEEHSEHDAGLYPLLGDFLEMLQDESSLVRARGFRLVVAQARWDSCNVIDSQMEKLFALLHDPKGTTARQFLQFSSVLLEAKPYLFSQVEDALKAIDLTRYPEGRPLLARDAQKLAAWAEKCG